ncbi:MULTISPECIES: hypothetical protein [unclassified Sphingopyxis]|uniref:hypothetical protein n=1 Tax=unclassified Sphingopyxis TaxID=2614943 RepID=UPI00285CC3AA|nr:MULTISPECIES: hypothetical protein [unclassified Sphingopyxis]MDR6832155.1 hypothetical protein [Sphingopyxis sp. BE122]MDR7227898.1 hypothetical protein [Sphingopyxis sp. BE259]
MRSLLFAFALAAVPATAQDSPFVGEYSLAEGPDVGGGLLIRNDGRFQYMLAAGALDERAEGRWEARGDQVCLSTDPKPVPPTMEKGPLVEVDGAVPTLLVTWPNGRGIPGVDFTIGFDRGDPIADYTQTYGWTMPEDDQRTPRWIEVREAIYNITAPRFDLTEADSGKVRAIIVPNDIGVVDFDDACAEKTERGITLHRAEGDMRFVRLGGE